MSKKRKIDAAAASLESYFQDNIHYFNGTESGKVPLKEIQGNMKSKLEEFYSETSSEAYVKELSNFFHTAKQEVGRGINPMSSEAMNMIRKNDGLRARYMKSIENTIGGNDPHAKSVIMGVVENSMEDMDMDDSRPSSPFQDNFGFAASQEAMGPMASWSNRNNYAGSVGFAVPGYFARSKGLTMFHALKSEGTDFVVTFNLDYVLDPDKSGMDARIYQPWGTRKGLDGHMFDPILLVPKRDEDGAFAHILDAGTQILAADGTSNIDAGDGWIVPGNTGNLISEHGDLDPEENGLDHNPVISAILYVSAIKGSSEAGYTYTYKQRKVTNLTFGGIDGETTTFAARADIMIDDAAWVDAEGEIQTGTIVEQVIATVGLDSGGYSVHSCTNDKNVASVIKGLKIDAYLQDRANNLAGPTVGTQKFQRRFGNRYSRFGRIPLSVFTTDNWNIGNDGPSMAAYTTDQMSKLWASSIDQRVEKHLYDQTAIDPSQYFLFVKQGGFERHISHDMALVHANTQGMAVNDGKRILRDLVWNTILESEMSLAINDNVPRDWTIYGHMMKTNAFLEIETRNDGELQQNTDSNGVYGFATDTLPSWHTSGGKHVNVIGDIADRLLDKDLLCALTVHSASNPTQLYHPQMIRMYTGIDPRFPKLPSILFYGRDNILSLSKVMMTISLSNYKASDYAAKVVENSKTRFFVTKED